MVQCDHCSQYRDESGGQVPTQKFSSDLSTDKLFPCNSITLHNVGAGGFFNCKNRNSVFSGVSCNKHSQLLLMLSGWDGQLSAFQLFSHGSSTVASLTCQGENYNCTLPQAHDQFY